jgi:hypothetical protein
MLAALTADFLILRPSIAFLARAAAKRSGQPPF